MSSFIATIGKESTENLDICIESSCFGITIKGNTANSHAKEAQIGDKLYFWVSGSGYDGYAQISKVEEVSSNSKIPNWTKPKQVNEIQNPWSFLLHFDNYTKLNERKYFSFVDGVQEITGVKQAWLLQSLIRLPEGFEINMDKALLNNEEVEVKEESKEERYLRMVAPRVKKAVKAINLIGNLGNKSLYEYSDAQKRKVFKYIDDAVAQMKKDLDRQTKDTEKDYDFT
tara:strand:+ start:230 stop:913 length:684 start_codon:yes stop_codon:yes gene_type:complete